MAHDAMDGPVHPEEIKARLRIRYGSVRAFEDAKGLFAGTVSQVINSGAASLRVAMAISDELGIPLHRVSKAYYKKLTANPVTRKRPAAHRQNAEAR